MKKENLGQIIAEFVTMSHYYQAVVKQIDKIYNKI